MKVVKRIGESTVIVDAHTVEFLEKRILFCEKYCKEKGWSLEIDELTLNQILEIRKQEGWITPR